MPLSLFLYSLTRVPRSTTILFLCFRSSVSDLQSHLSTLELRVARETRRRLSLEDEVRRLRDENRRLQDESHAAAQQLRRFTEWFFQTIDHQ